MKYELFISFRYLLAKKKQKFISLVTLISILGITVGVCSLVIVVSVMNGFDHDLMDKILGMHSHLSIQNKYGIKNYPEILTKIEKIKNIKAASPVLMAQIILRHKNNVRGVLIKGIDIDKEKQASKLFSYIKTGKNPLLSPKNKNILIGKELAESLNLKINDKVSLISPVSRGKKSKLIPIVQEVIVSGIFESGMYEYDAGIVIVSLETAAILLDVKAKTVSSINIMINNNNNILKVKNEIQTLLNKEYKVKTWFEQNKNLFSAIKLEKKVMFIILCLIIFVAAFNIISSLIMAVMEKTKDIGILKSLGASQRSIMFIFSIEGIIIGLIGTFLGTTSGLCFCFLLKKYNFINLPNDIYYITKLPIKINSTDIFLMISITLLISFLASLYPAYKASKINPIEALRYE